MCLRRGLARYKKFQLAVNRLNKEQDIQYLIEMNRVTRLLHKINFLSRQSCAINYSHKYVITAKDIKQAEAERNKP